MTVNHLLVAGGNTLWKQKYWIESLNSNTVCEFKKKNPGPCRKKYLRTLYSNN